MLAVTKIDINGNSKNGNNYDIQKIFMPADGGKPTCFSGTVDYSDLTGTLGNGPDVSKEGNNLNGNIVHHKCEQCFIGVPLCTEHGGNKSPDCACGNGSNYHNGKEQQGRKLIAEKNHTACGSKTAYKNLTFCSCVPKAHFKCGSYRKGNAKKNCDVLEKTPYTAGSSKGTVYHCGVYSQWILSGQKNGNNGTDDKRRSNRTDSDKPGFPPNHGGTLYYMKQRLVLCCSGIIHLFHLCSI